MGKTGIQNGNHGFIEKYGIAGILLVIILVFHLLSDSFLTVQNFSNILMNEVVTGCLALGGIFILTVDEFDLSLGYILCFCMVLGAFLAKLGCTGVAVIPVMVLAGAGCGAINGLIVTKFKVSSFIATMSVGLTLSGITQALSGGGILNTNIPKILTSFSRGKVFWVGYSVILFFILCVIIRFMLNETEFGRHLYAVGISGRTAAYAGIKVGHVRLAAFTCAGLFCGIAAAVLLGQLGAASSAYGTSLLLPAYSVVFLSKASFTPGRINVPGLLAGLLLCALGENGIEIAGAPVWGSYVFQGGILIVSIWISIVLTNKSLRTK
ncbi:ABC transporter permease [Luxibacter massiliensis]|uniref:ABC transporter permease n=1 Tax=Luxibacter massiliensis TaxID=2219695 RepID=UPI000F07033A|nr:ABC transporter permease [Luxibacter massiliensis]